MSHPPQPDPLEPEEVDLFQKGLSQFNAGDFFEAHETWEDLWRDASGDDRLFYQGLIQLAVTLVHVQQGNPRGVRNVWRSAQTKFAGLSAVYQGVDTPALLVAMENFLAPVLAMDMQAFEPGKGRGQHLDVDWQRVPRIVVTQG